MRHPISFQVDPIPLNCLPNIRNFIGINPDGIHNGERPPYCQSVEQTVI